MIPLRVVVMYQEIVKSSHKFPRCNAREPSIQWCSPWAILCNKEPTEVPRTEGAERHLMTSIETTWWGYENACVYRVNATNDALQHQQRSKTSGCEVYRKGERTHQASSWQKSLHVAQPDCACTCTMNYLNLESNIKLTRSSTCRSRWQLPRLWATRPVLAHKSQGSLTQTYGVVCL